MKRDRMKIAVASGKGGTGKTTVATNLAYVLSQGSAKVTYVDCDVEEPNGHLFLPPDFEERHEVSVVVPEIDTSACTFCGLCAEVCEFNALAVVGDTFLPFPTLCHSCGACITLCPDHALSEGLRPIGFIRSGTSGRLFFVGGCLNVGEAQAPPVIRAVKDHLVEDGIAVIDAPPGTSCPVVETVRGADYIILVTEPTPFGLNDLRLAVCMLRELKLAFGVVMNRSDIGDGLVRDYCNHENIRILAELPFDRTLAEAYAEGRMVAAESPLMRERMINLFQLVLEEIRDVRARSSQR
jgi:MinD superfamily P-loop ATPase